jgi:hypothetical protein
MMGIIITIFVLIGLVYAIVRNSNKKEDSSKSSEPPDKLIMGNVSKEYNDNSGFMTIVHTRVFERRTFIKGELKSKYYGELDRQKESMDFIKERFYDFSLYDAEISSASFRRNNDGPFPEFLETPVFRGNINPNPLPCIIEYKGVSGNYLVQLYDIRLAGIQIDQKLHQVEEHEVFGTLYADVTGYLLEEFTEQWEETVHVEAISTKTVSAATEIKAPAGKAVGLNIDTSSTGSVKPYRNYKWDRGTYQYTGKAEPGCVAGLGEILSIIMIILFFLSMGPYGIVLLIILGFIFLLLGYFGRALVWIFQIGLVVFILLTVISIIGSHRTRSNSERAPENVDEVSEVRTIKRDSRQTADSILIQHRVWQDYDENQYEGDYSLSIQDLVQSRLFKNKLTFTTSTTPDYDKMLYYLKSEDASKLKGLYVLFDSLRQVRQLDSIAFAEMIVCFVQDIPYTLILDKACDPGLYTDRATRDYLLKGSGDCDGDQRFGINTPVEFLGSLKGDCDTRTLLLYTIFARYNYSVAILSSEIYTHSILAVNLPLPGKAYLYRGQRYVVWETTASGIRPGLLSGDISNFNFWRISLLSNP